MQASKKLLIVAETFPPMPGIGGRRWAKFAKYLQQLGVEVHVLSQAYTGSEQSLWSADVRNLDASRLHTFGNPYPEILRQSTLTFLERIRYRLALARVMRRVDGNPYDRTALIERAFTQQLSQLIDEHRFRTVVVSGPSFNLLYFAAVLRQKRGDFNLWVDFRDGWTWDNRYGISILSQARKTEEGRKEAFVVAEADRILTPSVFHFTELQRLYPNAASKLNVTTHAFDTDDLPSLNERLPKGENYIYGGSLYNGLESVFTALNRSFVAIYPKTVRIDCYLSNPNKLAEYLQYVDERWHPYFVLHKQLKPKEFYIQVSAAKMFVFWAGVPTKISSKVYEILSCGTPIVNISKRGELADFLEAHQVGMHFTPEEFCFAHIDGIFDRLKPTDRASVAYPDYKTLASNLANELE